MGTRHLYWILTGPSFAVWMKMVQWLTLSSLVPSLMAVAVAAVAVGLMEDQNNSRSWANITHQQFLYSPSIPISYTVRQFIYWDILG
jgi:hypothetical protein